MLPVEQFGKVVKHHQHGGNTPINLKNGELSIHIFKIKSEMGFKIKLISHFFHSNHLINIIKQQ